VLAGKYTIDEPEWTDVSKEAKDLVKALLAYDPDNRITATNAMNHPWIKKMASVDKVNKEFAIKTL
jgi:calcium-dependent protein kinase